MPHEIKDQYVNLFKHYKDIFIWSYDDLKNYDTYIIQHKIPLKPEAKPFQQKLRKINIVLLPIIEREIKNLFDENIIVALRYFEWITNLVLVRKKNGEIRLCVEFRNLNKLSLKDNYMLPKMNKLLPKFLGSARISMLDGFLDITIFWLV